MYRITTGAPVPDGAVAIVMVEDTKLIEHDNEMNEIRIEILSNTIHGANIRQVGSDMNVNDIVLEKDCVISSFGGEIGLLVSANVLKVQIYERPIVGILSTGSELVDFDHTDEIPYGFIRDANRPSLKSAIASAGFKCVDLGIVKDSVDSIESILRTGLETCHVIITTGGVSMGELDLLKPIIEQKINGKIHFGRVALKPGKPTTFATVGEKLIFSLAGNPVSAMVTFHLFVIPALNLMCGGDYKHNWVTCKLAHDIDLDSFRVEFKRCKVQVVAGAFVAFVTGKQHSSRIQSLVCNGLLKCPMGARLLKNDECEVLLLS